MSGFEGPLARRFEAQVKARGSALAVQCGTQQLSYRTLDSLVEANRRALLAQGRGPGQRLGWLGENGVEMLAALLACARLGVVFVPLDPMLDLALQRAWVRQARLHGVLATADAAPRASVLRADVLEPTAPEEPLGDGDLLLTRLPGRDSGLPRTATQSALLATAEAAITTQGLATTDRVLVAQSLADPDTWCHQVLPALLCGAALNLLRQFDPGAWLAVVATWRASTSRLSVPALQAVVAHPAWAAADLSSLRVVAGAAAELPAPLVQAFGARGVGLLRGLWGGASEAPA